MAIDHSEKLARLEAEIRDELTRLDKLFAEWKGVDVEASSPSIFLRGKASILHDFYCGVERIFKKIGNELNGGIPAGDSWHRQLLNDMRLEIPNLRPPVISEATFLLLLEFLSFRHKFRNIYGFDLDMKRVEELEQDFPEAHKKFNTDVGEFLKFVKSIRENNSI